MLYKCLKDNDFEPVPRTVFERVYREKHGSESFLDIDLALSNSSGIRCLTDSQGQHLLGLSRHFMLGNEIVEVLKSRGGVVPLENLLGAYKKATGRNLDPTCHGADTLERLLAEQLHHFVSVRGRSVVLRAVDTQLTARERDTRTQQQQQRPDVIAQTRDTDTGGRRLHQLATQLATCHVSSPGGVVSPALRSVRKG